MRAPGGFRTRLFEAALLLAASLACLLLAELACRVFLPQWKPQDPVEGLWRYDALLGWAHQPGRVVRWRIRDASPTVTLSSAGLRDREYPLARSPGRRRMLVLGDSMAWGWGVEDDEVVSERLEARHPDWEILNAGVAGYATDQQLLYWEQRGRRWAPDVVLLLFHPNDALENESTTQGLHYKPAFRLEGGALVAVGQPVPEPSWGQVVGKFLRAHSYLFGRVHRRLWDAWLEPRIAPASGRLSPDGPEVDYLLSMRLLLALAQSVEAAGSRFLVASVPMPEPETAPVERSVAKTLAWAGVPYLPLTAAFGDRLDALMQRWNGHWNAEGHAVAASAIEVFLVSEGVFRGH
jgi:lysophospholipase L1-like esterase